MASKRRRGEEKKRKGKRISEYAQRGTLRPRSVLTSKPLLINKGVSTFEKGGDDKRRVKEDAEGGENG